tara:strand:+ start:335 stop:529 length:195 start_codon:yes stop_codon:yes gene_type:complete
MIQIEDRTGQGGSTPRLHHKHTDLKLVDAYKKVYGDRWKDMWVKYHWCVYDGGELGSTDENRGE